MEVVKELQYVAAEGAALSQEQADRYGRRIECLALQLNRAYGGITQEDVVADAGYTDSPLHEYFDWNNEYAGHQYRLQQAGRLFRGIKIIELTVVGEPATTRKRINLTVTNPDTDKRERSYIAIDVVDSKPELRVAYLEQSIRELRSWLRKWERYEELSEQVLLVREALGTGAIWVIED